MIQKPCCILLGFYVAEQDKVGHKLEAEGNFVCVCVAGICIHLPAF